MWEVVDCKMHGGIPGLYPLDARGTNHASITYFRDIKQLFNFPYPIFLLCSMGMMMAVALT